MPDPIIVKGEVWEEQNPTFCWRATGANGAVLVQADLSTGTGSAGTGVDIRVYDISANEQTAVTNPTTAIYSLLGQAASAYVFNSLQTDGYWNADSDGYNVRVTIDCSQSGLVIEGGHKYRASVRLNTTAWGPVFLVGEWLAKPIWST